MVHVDRVQIHVMQDLQVDTQHDHVDEDRDGHVMEVTDEPMQVVVLQMPHVHRCIPTHGKLADLDRVV